MPMAFFCIAGSLAYTGGMFLNDAFDANYDRMHQPFRPIPAGEISRGLVFALGFGLLFLSFALFFLTQLSYGYNPETRVNIGFYFRLDPHFFAATGALYGSIVLYNWIHKRFSFSVLIMAAARASLIFVVAASLSAGLYVPVLVASAVHFVYISSLTLVARLENRLALFKGKIPYLIAGVSGVDAALVLFYKQNFIFAGLFLSFVFLTLFLQKWVRGT